MTQANDDTIDAADYSYVFYIYEDDEEDPRFSFWMESESDGISLYERPPDGQGMWLKIDTGSDYGKVVPTDEFESIIAGLMGDGVDGTRVDDLPSHERFFTKAIFGTIEQNPDAIPGPVWNYLHECGGVSDDS